MMAPSVAAALLRIAVVALSILPNAEALVVVGRSSPSSSRKFALARSIADPSRSKNQPLPPWSNRHAIVMRSTPTDDEDNETEDTPKELSLVDKINNFLDTPILDANNRSDQGAVAEVLKDFVRDEPELAQITFSVVVVAILALVTKVVLSL